MIQSRHLFSLPLIPLILCAGSLFGHPDPPPEVTPMMASTQPDPVELEQLRYYFDLFTQAINETITPFQQDAIDQANALYKGIVPWEDGGDPDVLFANAEALLAQYKSRLPGYTVEWKGDEAVVQSPRSLPLTYGLPGYIWLEVANGSEAVVVLSAREEGYPAGLSTAAVPSGASRLFLVPLAARSAGNDRPLQVNLVSHSPESSVRKITLPADFHEAAKIRGRVLEEANGKPFPGRVHVIGPDGLGRIGEAFKNNSTLSEKMIFEISSKNKYGSYRLPFFYSDSTFEVIVPAGEINLVLERGYEHAVVSETVTLSPGEVRHVTLSSGRILDMKQLGWISGDTHIHWVKNWWSENEDIGLLAMVQRAEDLRVANNLTLFQYRPESQGGNFTTPSQFPPGPVASLSDDAYHIQMGEEWRNDHYYGHLCFLNIDSLIQPISTGQGSGGPPGAYDWPLNKTAIEACRAQGGISTEAHNLGPNHRSDVPVNAVMGLSDAFDQLEPKYYYRFLDSGLKIPLGNGSDHPARTVGSARMYVKVDGGFTYANWIEGIRQGRTFTTSGPLVFLSVNGSEIGDTLAVSKGDTLFVKAEVVSRYPVGNFQIVSNGEVIAQTVTQGKTATLELDMPADRGRWFVARCSQTDDYAALNRPNIAHTSGLYVEVDGKGPFDPDAARSWVVLLKAHYENVEANASFERESQRRAQLDYIEKGIKQYEALIDEYAATPHMTH